MPLNVQFRPRLAVLVALASVILVAFRPAWLPPWSQVSNYRVAVLDTSPFHDEVLGGILYTLSRMKGVSTTVYRDKPRFNFDVITRTWDLSWASADLLRRDLAWPQDGQAKAIDAVIMPTCDVGLHTVLIRQFTEVTAAFNARPEEAKFRIVCIIHRPNMINSSAIFLTELVRRQALRLMSLSSHHKDALREALARLPDKGMPWGQQYRNVRPDYAGVPISTVVPIFPTPDNEPRSNRSDILSHLVIQGHIHGNRRRYNETLAELEELLLENPRLWGYLPRLSPDGPLIPACKESAGTCVPPLTLSLVGNGTIPISKALERVVTVYSDLPYVDYYSRLREGDLLLPPFADEHYYNEIASSSIPTALMTGVPILAEEKLLRSYSYLDRSWVSLKPEGMTELQWVKKLRTEHWTRPRIDLRSLYEHNVEQLFSLLK